MPGRYIAGLQTVLRDNEAPELLSLATVDPVGIPPDIRDQVLAAYIGHPDAYVACHNVGAILLPILATAAPTVQAAGAGAPAAGSAAILLGQRVIKVDYGFHTFTIIADGASIECVEGWAGSAPGSPGVIVFTLHDCILTDADYIRPTRANAAAAMAGILSPVYATRNGHVNTISRGGRNDVDGIQAFEGVAGIKPLTVTVGVLDTVANAVSKMRARVNLTKDWVHRVSSVGAPRAVCWQCLRIHGAAASSAFGRWHRCGACARTYCDTCGAALQRPEYFTRERLCDCGGRTALVA